MAIFRCLYNPPIKHKRKRRRLYSSTQTVINPDGSFEARRLFLLRANVSDLVKVIDVKSCSACGEDHELTVIPLQPSIKIDDLEMKSQGICSKSRKVVYSTYEFNAPLLTEGRQG